MPIYHKSFMRQIYTQFDPVNYDKEAVSSIIKATPILHVSFNAPFSDDSTPQFPTILPMLGAMSTYPSDNEPSIYLHGSSSARLMRLTSGHEDTGLPVCISATILDGYVLALTPFNHSCNYRSVVAFGHATRVTDADETVWAMELITNRLIPDRWATSRTPPTKAEVTATGILKVRIETASAKTRTGGPHDDKKDLKNEDATSRVWTGTVPVYEVLGEPVPSADNQVKQVPGNIAQWVQESNQSSREYATVRSLEE